MEYNDEYYEDEYNELTKLCLLELEMEEHNPMEEYDNPDILYELFCVETENELEYALECFWPD